MVARGKQEADNEFAAIRILQGRNIIITKISTADAGTTTLRQPGKKRPHRGVYQADLLFFIRQTAVLLDAGVPLLRTLEVILSQIDSLILQETVRSIIADLRAGSTFMAAIGRYPKVFPSWWTYLIEAGEAGGHLSLVLNQLSEHIEASIKLKKKIVSAMIYPTVVIVIAIVAFVVFMIVLIPTFAKLFAQFNAKLPALTQAIINISEFTKSYILYILIATAALVSVIRRYLRTPNGKKAKDTYIIKVPVIGSFIKDIILARVTLNLSTLIQSGVNLLQGINISGRAADNCVFEEALKNVEHDIQQGKTLSNAFAESAIFPPMVTHMVMIGEESGQLAPMIKRVAVHYQAKVDVFVERLSTLIEPVMVILVGGMVGVMVISMFLPIISLSTAIH